jgi:hypothetical protein
MGWTFQQQSFLKTPPVKNLVHLVQTMTTHHLRQAWHQVM